VASGQCFDAGQPEIVGFFGDLDASVLAADNANRMP
jgi:hypothetical protein